MSDFRSERDLCEHDLVTVRDIDLPEYCWHMRCRKCGAECNDPAELEESKPDLGFDEWIARELPRATGYEIDLCRTVWIAASKRDSADGQSGAMHASAPEGHKCSDCTMDCEPCPTCYEAWWKTRRA